MSPKDRIKQLLADSGIEPGPETPCPYLPGRSSRSLAILVSDPSPGLYHALMDLNFRRSGEIFYRPECRGCRECRAIRVLVDEFRPNRSQRRCWLRNQDLSVQIAQPVPTEEKHRLYSKYLWQRHSGSMDGSWEEFCRFLYDSPIRSAEMVYRLGTKLVGVGIVDVEPRVMSTVFCYFEPSLGQRSLGVFNVLWAIEHCRRERIEHLYLGYHVPSCAKMNYKANFRPYEKLAEDGRWLPG